MSQIDYKDLFLSSSEKRILKRFSHIKHIPKSIHDNPKYNFLFKYYLLDYADSTHSSYRLSDKAHFLIRYELKDKWRFMIPVLISVFALILSIISILLQLY